MNNTHKTHCPAGHPYDEANTYIAPNGWRQCMTCRREHQRTLRESLAGREERVTKCANGHPYGNDPVRDARGHRICRICRPERRTWQERHATCANGHPYAENVPRGKNGRRICPLCRRPKNPRKTWEEYATTCKNGHLYTEDTPRGANGRRLCALCDSPKGPKPISVEVRLWRKVQRGGSDDCWLWLGGTNGSGYGVISRGGRGTQTYVHRVAWELERGPIPENLEIDHLCQTRGCVNVRHMELVTHAENNRRSGSPAGRNVDKTHCPAGHPYDEANTYRPPGAPNTRMCRACMAIREAKRPKRSKKRDV